MNRQSYAIKLNYTYDKLGRLTSVATKGGQEISYAYDAAGNQISVIVKGEAAPVSRRSRSPTAARRNHPPRSPK